MEEACEIPRRPAELVTAALARTSPSDACRAAAVSPAFRGAADSDDVWARFLPPGGLPPLADGELVASAPPASKKEMFLRISAGPVLLQDRLAAVVSPTFRGAADSDDVWARFLPPGGLPPLADGELVAPAPPAYKKELFLRLSAGPVLLQDKLAAAVSPAFRGTADSDDVWARFLPPGGLPPLADGGLVAPAPPASKKELFLRLSAGPVLLQDRLVVRLSF